MRTFKLNGIFILFGIFVAMLFAITPSIVADGGPEPGAGCGEGFKYVAPPYIGDVTITLDDNNDVDIYGLVEQVGKRECFGSITAENAYKSIPLDKFQNLKPNDLRQTCLEEGVYISIECEDIYTYYEVVAVGNMKWQGDRTFTAKFVIMALE